MCERKTYAVIKGHVAQTKDHVLPSQLIMCDRNTCFHVNASPRQKSSKTTKRFPNNPMKTPPTAPKRFESVAGRLQEATLAWNNPKQARRTKQNRISRRRPPIKVVKMHPKGVREPPHEQCFEGTAKKCLESKNSENLIF